MYELPVFTQVNYHGDIRNDEHHYIFLLLLNLRTKLAIYIFKIIMGPSSNAQPLHDQVVKFANALQPTHTYI